MKPPPLAQLVTEAPTLEPGGWMAPREAPSEHHRAWIRRKRREREGLPLRPCDLEQIREQLEDL